MEINNMENLTEPQIRKIVQDEIKKNYRSGDPKVPPHFHNGLDNFQLNLNNIIGTNPIPFSNDKFVGGDGTVNTGYASPEALSAAGSSNEIINNYILDYRHIPISTVPNNITCTVPVPVIAGGNASYGLSQFAGGAAPIGTVLGFTNATNHQIWIMLADGWYGTELTLTPFN